MTDTNFKGFIKFMELSEGNLYETNVEWYISSSVFRKTIWTTIVLRKGQAWDEESKEFVLWFFDNNIRFQIL